VADILDIICGNIGNKDWLIWNEYYNGNKIPRRRVVGY
jgi:hypothetical protein